MREAIIKLGDRQLEAIGLDDVVGAAREAGLEDVTELVCHGAGGVLQVRVRDPIPAEDLDHFESVVWWERLAADEDGVTYLCKIDPPDYAADHALDDHSTAHEIAGVDDAGIDLSVIGSQEEIGESIAAVDEAGMTALLERLTDYRGSSSTMAGLTDRQREVVETAYEMGYYDVPRTTSSEAIAEEVGLDPSTVAEHLQRAERNLMDRVLDGSG